MSRRAALGGGAVERVGSWARLGALRVVVRAGLGSAAFAFGASCAGAAADAFPLTLRGAVLMVLERSPELQVERLDAAAQGTLPDEARAEFDPQVSATYRHGESQRQTTARQSALETSAETIRRGRLDEGTVELTKSFATGTEIALSAEGNRSRSNVSAEEFAARAEARLNQPLLRGLRPSVNLARVRIAENNAQIGRYEFIGALQDLLAGVEAAYWDMVFARWELEARVESLDTARQLLSEARARVDAGKLPRVELAAARAEVAAREEAVEDARAGLEAARLELLRWLNPDETMPWTSTVDPVDDPAALPARIEADAAVAFALEQRPDLLQARLDLSNGELEVVQTRDGLLPKLDFFAAYAHTGLGTTFKESWETVFEKGFEDWTLGVTLETALGWRAERSRYRRAEFNRDRAREAVQNLELNVQAQVRQALIEVERLRRKIELAAVTKQARREEALAEKAKFQAGRAASSDVLQAENRFREAELGWRRAQTDARKAWAELARLEGRLIEAWGVEVF